MFGIDLLSVSIGIVIGGTCTACVPKAWAYIKDHWVVKMVMGWFKKSEN